MISRDIRRKFGQNYLSDPAIIFEIGQAISPQTNSNFFEIGPGMGALTNTLNQDGIFIKDINTDMNLLYEWLELGAELPERLAEGAIWGRPLAPRRGPLWASDSQPKTYISHSTARVLPLVAAP